MQYKIRVYLLLALIIALAFSFYYQQKYQSLANLLFDENKQLKNKLETINDNDLKEKIKTLEAENKALKDQIFQLEREQFLFKSNQNPKYNLEDKLKFQDDTKDIEVLKEDKKEEEYIITPSVDIDTEKKEIDGLKLKIETKF